MLADRPWPSSSNAVVELTMRGMRTLKSKANTVSALQWVLEKLWGTLCCWLILRALQCIAQTDLLLENHLTASFSWSLVPVFKRTDLLGKHVYRICLTPTFPSNLLLGSLILTRNKKKSIVSFWCYIWRQICSTQCLHWLKRLNSLWRVL